LAGINWGCQPGKARFFLFKGKGKNATGAAYISEMFEYYSLL